MYDGNRNKYLTVARLAELLAQLPPDYRLRPNEVKNIAIVAADGSECLGMIDFLLEGEVEYWFEDFDPNAPKVV